jgi:hypothetical protein
VAGAVGFGRPADQSDHLGLGQDPRNLGIFGHFAPHLKRHPNLNSGASLEQGTVIEAAFQGASDAKIDTFIKVGRGFPLNLNYL